LHSENFVVDASLLKELGERLIGRPNIALAELVKNSYDADAANCRIEFGYDQIIVADDGTGMSEAEFLNHWMRIGTTHKIDELRSRKLGRPLTGSKGIGRLAMQFLADEMTLESTSVEEPGRLLYVFTDWRHAVRGTSLDTVKVEWEVRSKTLPGPDGHPSGTRITLEKLKTHWDVKALEGLGDEVWRLRSPFKRSTRRADSHAREDFDIEIVAANIAGAREAFDRKMRTLFSNWKARIRGVLDQGRSGGKANISVEFRPEYPEGSHEAATFREIVELPIRLGNVLKPLVDRANFEILIFKTEGRQPGGIPVGDLRTYLAEFGNVSLYDAGFRLPYYGSGRDAAGQDWLSIALDQGRRLNASELLPEHLRTQNKYMQDLPAPGRIFGAVEIDTNHERVAAERFEALPGEWLQIQPGRDRLHDNLAFGQLRELVRFSLDFYANRFRLLALQAVEEMRQKEPPSRKFGRVLEVLERSKTDMPAAVFQEIRREVVEARKATTIEEEARDQRAALLAPLAAAGMAALALNHELSRETRFSIESASNSGALRGIARLQSSPRWPTNLKRQSIASIRYKSYSHLFYPTPTNQQLPA
jgi:hypothetical protein